MYLHHFTLKSTTHALALKPKPLVVRTTDRGRDPGSLKKWYRSPRLWHRSPIRACYQTMHMSEKAHHIYETYKNTVMPHGRHIYSKASDMVNATMCTYPHSDHALPH